MPRTARVVVPNCPHHIVQCGHNRNAGLGCDYAENKSVPVFAHMDMALIGKIRDATNGNFALGNMRFSQEIAQTLMRRVVPGKAGRPKMKSGEA